MDYGRIYSDGDPLDNEVITFGIRDAHFDAATGFWLNGKNFKVKGVCLHADGGAFGMAVPLAVWEERLEELRKLGVNAIRTAHNPPAPEFLDLCDRMGFLVMDEMFDCWTVAKNPIRLSSLFQRLVADGRARLNSPRPQSSEHHPLQRRQRNPRHAAGGEGQEDSCRTRRRRARSRSDPAGHAGVVPPERQPRLRRRPGGHA